MSLTTGFNVNLSEVRLMGQASQAAFIGGTIPEGWNVITPAALGISPQFQDGNYFTSSGASAIVLQQGNTYIVAFRGTDGSDDVSQYPELFFGTYIDHFQPLLSAVAAQVPTNASLYFTGASLGGGATNLMADIAGTEYGGRFAAAKFVAFASPNITDANGILNFGFQNDPVYRFINNYGNSASSLDNLTLATAEYMAGNYDGRHPQAFYAHSADALGPDALSLDLQSVFYDQMTPDSILIFDANAGLVQDVTPGQENTGVFYVGEPIADQISGRNGNDFIEGFGGADILSGGLGNDQINGGGGTDTAVFTAGFAAYTVVRAGGVVQVTGPDGIDTLGSIERLQFADAIVSMAKPHNDFDGDGRADILFSQDGAVVASDYQWQINDRAISAQGPVDLYDKAFTVQVIGDFNADGKSDVAFHNPTTGGVWQWLLDGTRIASQGAVDVAGPGYHLLGSADFNGDDRDDLLFRNDAGLIYQWQMHGITKTGVPVGPLDPHWHVAGAGDFDGDGKADLLLRNIGGVESENGAFFLWKMDGANIIGQGGIERPGADWVTLGTGDFNGDGKTDFAVRHVSNFQPGETPGAVWVYLMDGTAIASQGAAGIADAAEFDVAGIADYNGDGKDDILFRNDAGFFYSWDMDGTHIQSEGALPWAAPDQQVIMPHWDLV